MENNESALKERKERDRFLAAATLHICDGQSAAVWC
jgi:hypothetical protein